ncbi:hypothetical protein [Actinokineospora bangkokensis]|uniref:Uncharacterized protein n=1 Tax=Actinokineospora bangkokensis TaxID=1193682 RepID=A0A1Q9LLG8_9PSEU|nr:hypothetical protein [Actinokineospora bangkokensis]OLR92887.1 hypothetical protein BJP25_18085 [Actinokineospora bangkokensis]
MPSITSWTRLEPRARAGDLRPALEAQVHDPLWALARQWQFGEFLGDDAGSPIWVRVRGYADRATRYRPGAATAEDYDPAVPLEAVVEREPEVGTDLRASAEAGQQLLRMLTAGGFSDAGTAIRQAYPLPAPTPDPAGPGGTDAVRRYLAVVGGRVPHAAEFAAEARATVPGGQLPARVQLAAARVAGTVAVVQRWLTWLGGRQLAVEPGREAWDAQRMEHRFAVGVDVGGTEVTLTAPEYRGGRLDWTDFTAGPAGGLGAKAARTPLTATTFPAPASFPGMPARRYWEFEDARASLGGVEAGPEELARMLLAEFATVFSNDWYVVPLDVPVGTLTTITSVVVADTFSSVVGGPTLLPAVGAGAGDGHWSLFRPSTTTGGRHPGLFLAPATAPGLDGEVLEEVLFARDEDANLAWAVERRVPDLVGAPLDRAGTGAAGVGGSASAPEVDPVEGALHYRVATTVPEHWVPMVPVEVRPGSVVLRRGHLSRRGPDGALRPAPALGRLLRPGAALDVREEEVPREGAEVSRAWQYARGADGRTYLWIGKRRRAGRGESASGLRFDVAE